MKVLRQSLTALLLGASLFGTGCTAQTGSDSANVTDDTANDLHQARPEAPGEFAIFRSATNEWFFHVVGENGEIVLQSEAYAEKPSAINGILSVKDNGVRVERYELGETADGQFYFVLRAANGQVIGESGNYATEDEADEAISSVRDLIAEILKYEAAISNGARFELEKWEGEWYFTLADAEGTALLYSEGYTSRTGAVNGIESVRDNGKDVEQYSLVEDEGWFYFAIKAGNGQIVGESDWYESREACEAGRDALVALLESERVGDPW